MADSPMLSLDDPKTRWILGMAQGLLQAGGASAMPVGLGQAFGQGLGQGNQAYDAATQAAQQKKLQDLHASLYEAQAGKLTGDAQRQQQLAAIMSGGEGGSSAAGGSAAPQGGPWSPQYQSANPPPSPADGFRAKGQQLLKGGFLKEGGDLIEAANKLDNNLEFKDGVWYDKRSGRPVAGGAGINPQGFGYQTQLGPNGQISMGVLPGAEGVYGTQQRIGEQEKARFDPFTVPASSPTAQPYITSRLNLMGGASPAGAPPIPGAPQSPGGVPAGMSPVVAAQQAARAAQGTSVSQNYGEMFNGMQKGAQANQEKIANLQRIDQLLGDFEGGKLSGMGLDIASAANSINVKFDKNLGNKQAAEQVSNEISLANRSTASGGGMPGAMSDADRNFLKAMSPSMSQSADGRKKIIEARIKVLERENHVAGMARAYQEKNGVIDGKFFTDLQAWSNKYPIFGK